MCLIVLSAANTAEHDLLIDSGLDGMARFFILFFCITIGLFTVQLMPWAQDALIQPFTSLLTKLSAKVITLWDGDVASSGKIIWDTRSGFAVSIEAGCNGIEACIVLIAAMLAFPASWTYKLFGTVIGTVLIQTLNLVRIISLFYLGQWNDTAFEWAHLYLWQALIMLDVLIVFLIWVRWVSTAQSTGAVNSPA